MCVVMRFAELENYSALDFSPMVDSARCDVIVDKPTILIKLDAGLSVCLSVYHILRFSSVQFGYLYGTIKQDITFRPGRKKTSKF